MKLPLLKSKKESEESLSAKLKRKIKEYIRVLKITKKPDMEEFKNAVKVTGLGIIIIGAIGFIIAIAVQLIK